MENRESIGNVTMLGKKVRVYNLLLFYRYVLEEYCTVRRSYLVQTFIEALTKGGPDNNPPPIEVHAHDPQKYVGDILAWLNQAILIERDNIHILVEKCNKAGIYRHFFRFQI